ncbi:ADH7-NADP(H)-dependent alcohol dehydrogenase [Fusarium pseudoanthophilum]|uniref:ADH7-NADP(H)-dependent alcohol dehydrogenase n=1 Tax=Fusarium pseudoanthophilum TaxID=48495 RepID=A0A8H5KEF8_9HYPO|nr:ADH7-NADP(H)-dependent alcohol dehydrogenase [Fusarium pseudoanthophilum]
MAISDSESTTSTWSQDIVSLIEEPATKEQLSYFRLDFIGKGNAYSPKAIRITSHALVRRIHCVWFTVEWSDGAESWEPEFALQGYQPELVYAYWDAKKGGRDGATGFDKFHVFAILDHGSMWDQSKRCAKPFSYKIQWVGYDEKDHSWEPAAKIAGIVPRMKEEIRLLNQTKLLKGRQRSLFFSFIHNKPILESEDSCSREVHPPPRTRLVQSADCKIMERNSSVSSALDPTTDDIGPTCNRGVIDTANYSSSSLTCEYCDRGQEIYCEQRQFYGFDKFDQGSFAAYATWNEYFLFRIPESIPSAKAAPLIAEVKWYHRVGVLGLGGLGHLAVQYAAKMGCHVTVYSHSPGKGQAARNLGASDF